METSLNKGDIILVKWRNSDEYEEFIFEKLERGFIVVKDSSGEQTVCRFDSAMWIKKDV